MEQQDENQSTRLKLQGLRNPETLQKKGGNMFIKQIAAHMPADNIFVGFQGLQVGCAIFCGNLVSHMEQLPDIFIVV